MDRATRKRLYNLCRPEEPLEPGDPRYVDVDALPGRTRGGAWAEALVERILRSDRPACALCTAQPGAGLSTELRRVAARLGDPQGANRLVVWIQAGEVLDLTGTVHVGDLLLAVVQRAEEALAAARGDKARAALRWFRRWLAPAAPPGGWTPAAPPAEHLRANAEARRRFRAEVDAERTAFVEEVRRELIVLHDEARRGGREGLVVVLDGLERLRGLTGTAREVLDSAARAFEPDAATRTLPIPVIWTVPCALSLRGEAELRWLPMIAPRARTGERREAGHTALLEVVKRRLSDTELAEVLGEAWEARAGRLMEASGGCLRDLVLMLRECVAASPLSESAFGRVLALPAEPRQGAVVETALPLLARAHATAAITPAGEAEQALAEQALVNGVLLRYEDESAWYDVHPAVRASLRGAAG